MLAGEVSVSIDIAGIFVCTLPVVQDWSNSYSSHRITDSFPWILK